MVYLTQKDRSAFVRNASAGAFNFTVVMWLLTIVGWILNFTIIGAVIGIPMVVIGAFGSIVLGIVGAIGGVVGLVSSLFSSSEKTEKTGSGYKIAISAGTASSRLTWRPTSFCGASLPVSSMSISAS